MKVPTCIVVLIFTLSTVNVFAQNDYKWGEWTTWGDQGDGTYCNPVLPSDYSDIDCIRVGDDYYAISSTFQYSPGMVIIHSKDLVNWTIKGHVVSDLRQISEEMNWTRMNRYGRGIWAGAIRYYQGKFYVYFGTPDEGYFMSTATDPAGPWEPLHCVKAEKGWDDCCPFFDDDGQLYFVGTHFADKYKTYLYRMTSDGKTLIEDSKILINEGYGREASKLYKINGTYYHFFSEVKNGGRYIMMQRSSSITGPYLERKQLSHVQREYNEPNQGGLVEGPDRKWYFLPTMVRVTGQVGLLVCYRYIGSMVGRLLVRLGRMALAQWYGKRPSLPMSIRFGLHNHLMILASRYFLLNGNGTTSPGTRCGH